MNTGLTELVFILDRSGSMGGLESDTIGGFNGMIERQKSEGKQVNVTTVLFDDQVEIIHDRFPIEIIEPLTEKEYYVRGCTALLDALGAAIEKIDNVQKHLPEAHKAGKVIFVITTDGLENSSENFTYEQIRRMISAKKECGWEFLFLGANIDAGKEAENTFLAEDDEVYEYGFSLDAKQVYEEWLMILTKDGFEPLFERQTDIEEKTTIEITSKFARKGSKNRELAELLKETIKEKQKNQLFLYKLYDNGIKRVEPVMEWFQSIQVIFPSTKVRFLPIRISRDIDFQKFMSDSLSKMDTGVVRVSAVSNELDFHDFAEKSHFPKELIQDIEEKKQGMFSMAGKYYIFGEKQGNRMTLIQIKFEHKLNSKSVEFDLEDESDGTQRLLDLLPMLFAMDKKTRNIYFVDEIDRSLHTKLSKYLLKLFLENSDESDCQIIYTAHDVNLIDLDNFAQDEIWFVEKKLTGETTIKPMSDFEVKAGQDVLKAYLSGRFGAVPVIKGGVDDGTYS